MNNSYSNCLKHGTTFADIGMFPSHIDPSAVKAYCGRMGWTVPSQYEGVEDFKGEFFKTREECMMEPEKIVYRCVEDERIPFVRTDKPLVGLQPEDYPQYFNSDGCWRVSDAKLRRGIDHKM